jgi:hypothetical protein
VRIHNYAVQVSTQLNRESILFSSAQLSHGSKVAKWFGVEVVYRTRLVATYVILQGQCKVEECWKILC